jgi:ribosome-binding factor A
VVGPHRLSGVPDHLHQQLLRLAADLHPEDGVDPELLRRAEPKPSAKQRKQMALCRQVQQTLLLSLPGDLDVSVLAVTPDRDPCRLIVLFGCDDPRADRAQVMERLESVKPQLRRDVAGAVSRRRVPDLVLRLSPL